MKLLTRLYLFGAAVPCVAAAMILGGAIFSFSRALDDELDRALYSQAAVEAVSLLDGPGGRLHLHMTSSPLLEQVRPYAPHCGVYTVNGTQVLAFPNAQALPNVVAAPLLSELQGRERRGDTSALFETIDDGMRRRIALVVREPEGEHRFFLVLEASRSNVVQTVTRVAIGGFTAVLVLAAVLAALASIWARHLAARVDALTQHMQRIGNGELGDVRRATVDDEGDDISTLQQAVVDAVRELRRARAERERFIADAAHELRTPLATLRVTLDLALRRPRSADELKEALQAARDETERLGRLAASLLDTSAALAAADEHDADGDGDGDGDVDVVIDATLEAWRARACDIGVTLQRRGHGGTVHVSASALRRVLDNLLDNALKHAPRDTVVEVAVEARLEDIDLVVRDAGEGIPEHERDAVFQPFHRVRHDRPGQGLGLALVAALVARVGGRAFVEPGDGGRVGITLLRAVSTPSSV
jgi:signal transduction histidine kinase